MIIFIEMLTHLKINGVYKSKIFLLQLFVIILILYIQSFLWNRRSRKNFTITRLYKKLPPLLQLNILVCDMISTAGESELIITSSIIYLDVRICLGLCVCVCMEKCVLVCVRERECVCVCVTEYYHFLCLVKN